jgi:UDP-glucose 4-epimerase
MKALVTGGAGFIGSHVVDRLMSNGFEVVVLDDFSTGSLENLPAGVECIMGSVGDAVKVEKACKGVQLIFHLAAVSSVQHSLARPLDVHDCNLTSTLLLLEVARKNAVKRFIFSSSAAVYGDTEGKPARESMKPMPLSHYAVQKLACEYYCSTYCRLYDLETVCLRYFNVFGPRQRGDSPYSGVVAKFLAAAQSGEPFEIYGDGCQRRDFCPVANVVEANLAAANGPSEKVAGEVFNVGNGVSTSVIELANQIKNETSRQVRIQHHPGKSGEIAFSQADLEKSSKYLSYVPKQCFADALRDLAKSSVCDRTS